MGNAGITINHYDMLGNRISLDPDYGTGLAGLKPMLDALLDLNLDDRAAHGVRILFDPRISRHIDTGTASRGYSSLSQTSTLWGDTCFILGIAHHYSREVESTAPVLVSQQTLRAFSDEQIGTLLSGAAVLDAESVEILLERGFGEEIGVRSARREMLAQTAYSYEQIEAERFGTEILPCPRMSAQRCSAWLSRFEPETGAESLSGIHSADHRRLWTAASLYRNARGGRIVSLTYPLNGEAQFFMGFFNVYRRRFLQRLFREIAPGARLAHIENHVLQAYRSPTADGDLLSAINATDDPAEVVVWQVGGGDFASGDWFVLPADGRWKPITPRRDTPETLRFDVTVAPLSGVFFRFANS